MQRAIYGAGVHSPGRAIANALIASCESASNLDPTPIEHQIVEAEAELSISGVFDRRPTGTPLFFSKTV
jgi:hypothetical protein